MLDKELERLRAFGFTPVVVDAPKDAVTFDKMVVVYRNKMIAMLYFWDSKTQRIVGSH